MTRLPLIFLGILATAAAFAEQRDSAPIAVTLEGTLDPRTDATPVFTPDGNTVFFDRSDSDGHRKTIMVAHRLHGQWGKASVAPFSGRWFDQNPAVSPDGSYLLFDSDRPMRPGDAPLVQSFFGKLGPGSNIWRVDLKGERFGSPKWLAAHVNDGAFVDFPAIAGDDSIYYLRADQGAVHIFRSQYIPTRYAKGVKVALADPGVDTHDPAVAIDESFIVLNYGRVKNGLGRLCILFREDDHWGEPIDLGDSVNHDVPWGARLAPDGRTLYFTGATKIWRLSLSSWLQHPQGPPCPRG
jgi:hypothetical protein